MMEVVILDRLIAYLLENILHRDKPNDLPMVLVVRVNHEVLHGDVLTLLRGVFEVLLLLGDQRRSGPRLPLLVEKADQ